MVAAKKKTGKKATKAVMESQVKEIFARSALLQQPKTEIAQVLNVCPSTVTKRMKTKTYEELRGNAFFALNDKFDGDVMQAWAGMIHKLANAKRKTNTDYASMKEALKIIQDTLGLDAPKKEEKTFNVNMLDLDSLEAAVDEALEDYETAPQDRIAIPQFTETVAEDQVEDDEPGLDRT